MMNRLKMGFGLTTALALTGCGSSPPECSDSDVTDTVTHIVLTELRKVVYSKEAARKGVYDELDYEKALIAQDDNALLRPFIQKAEERFPDDFIELEAIRTQGIDEKLLATDCVSQMVLSSGDVKELEYRAQVTEDGDIWVEVFGL